MGAKRKTIFLVDDEMTNLALGKKVLSGVYDVFAIESGAGLLEMLEFVIPDLILLDIRMPGMDGYEVIQRLKGNGKTAGIPVIFLTAHKDKNTVVKCISLGAVDYIVKPFEPSELLDRVRARLA